MTPPINRFIAALQGIATYEGTGEGGEALEIAESLLANGDFLEDEVAHLAGPRSGIDLVAAPLVRAVPCGLFYFRDLGRLRTAAEKACRLTHTAPADIAAAVGMATAVARLLPATGLNSLHFVRETAEALRPLSQDAYVRILGLVYPLRKELSFLCSNFDHPLELFRAALYLFLSCQACDLQTEAERLELADTPVLPLANALAGCLGTFCRIEKPTLRIVMLAEAFHAGAALAPE